MFKLTHVSLTALLVIVLLLLIRSFSYNHEAAILDKLEGNVHDEQIDGESLEDNYYQFFIYTNEQVKENLIQLIDHLVEFNDTEIWKADHDDYRKQLIGWLSAFSNQKEVPTKYSVVHSTYEEGINDVKEAFQLAETTLTFGDNSHLEEIIATFWLADEKFRESESLVRQLKTN